jgi:hypothetical protein
VPESVSTPVAET